MDLWHIFADPLEDFSFVLVYFALIVCRKRLFLAFENFNLFIHYLSAMFFLC